MIPSKLVKEEDLDHSLHFCYNASKKWDIYGLFPGHSVFVSVFHPFKAIESKQITGEAVYKVHATGKFVQRIPSTDCKAVDANPISLEAAHEDFELW